jgi:hypothetical protein
MKKPRWLDLQIKCTKEVIKRCVFPRSHKSTTTSFKEDVDKEKKICETLLLQRDIGNAINGVIAQHLMINIMDAKNLDAIKKYMKGATSWANNSYDVFCKKQWASLSSMKQTQHISSPKTSRNWWKI